MDKRTIELISGIASGAIGLAGLAYALFGPTYSFQRIESRADGTTTVTSGSASLLEVQELGPVIIAVLIVFVVLVLSVTVGAYLHSRRGYRAGWIMLGIATAILGFCVIVTG